MPTALHPFLTSSLEIVVVVAFIILALAFLLSRKPKPWLSCIRSKSLLTQNEVDFFHRLERALPDYHVFPQVAFGTILDVDGKKDSFPIRNRFSQKVADFVVCEHDTLEVVALVELDDRTHDAARDKERDDVTKAAGYQTICFQSRRKPSVAEIAAHFPR
jgi:hypothetical protein